MRIIIDRIENDIAVTEAQDGKMYNIPKAFFGDCREGDCYVIEKEENSDDYNRISNKLKDMFID